MREQYVYTTMIFMYTSFVSVHLKHILFHFSVSQTACRNKRINTHIRSFRQFYEHENQNGKQRDAQSKKNTKYI